MYRHEEPSEFPYQKTFSRKSLTFNGERVGSFEFMSWVDGTDKFDSLVATDLGNQSRWFLSWRDAWAWLVGRRATGIGDDHGYA